MGFLSIRLSRDGRDRQIVPEHRIGSIEGGDDADIRVRDVDGKHLGWVPGFEVPCLNNARAVVPAHPGWWVVLAREDRRSRIVGLDRHPVVAWRVDRIYTLPVTTDWGTNIIVQESYLGGPPYLLLPPEGPARCCGETIADRSDASLLAYLRDLHRSRASDETADRYAEACHEGEG